MSAGPTPDADRDDRPPGGWIVWNDEAGGPATWVYEPGTFDAERFPAPCLPTIQVSRRHGHRRPPGESDGAWRAVLTLEPDVALDRTSACPTRDRALAGAHELASRFVGGGYDLRDAYQDPSDREGYLAALADAVGASTHDS